MGEATRLLPLLLDGACVFELLLTVHACTLGLFRVGGVCSVALYRCCWSGVLSGALSRVCRH